MLLLLLPRQYSIDSKSTNIRECIRIARLTHGDIDVSKLDKILETFAKYGAGTDKTDQA